MKKYGLTAFLFLSACATQPYQFADVNPSDGDLLSLDQVVIGVSNLDIANDRFQNDLGFTATDSKTLAATFQNNSSLVLQQTSGHEGAKSIRIRTNNLDKIRTQAQARQVPFTEYKLKDNKGHTYAQVLDFKPYGPLKLFSFIRYASNYSAPIASHRNKATNLHEVWFVADNVYQVESELARIGFEFTGSRILQPMRANAKAIRLDQSELVFVERDHLEARDKTHLTGEDLEVVGMSITVSHIEAFARSMERERRIQFATTRYSNKSCILIPPKYTNGLWMELARGTTRDVSGD